MDFFEEWYSPQDDYYDENDEKERERLLASMLAAAADIPTGGLRNTSDLYPGSAHDPDDFINRMSRTDLIQQLINGNPADINSWFEDRKDLPVKDQSVYDFLRKPEEPLGDLGFFDRTAPANLFPPIAGSAEPDDDFWGGLQRGSSQEAQAPSVDATREQEEAQNVSGHPAADRNSYDQYEDVLDKMRGAHPASERNSYDKYEDVLDRTTGAGGISVDPGSYLVYKDGQLSVHDDNDNEYMRIPASSGEPGVTDPTLKRKGPIPPGRYWFDPREISPSGFLRRNIDRRDWGDYRVRLYPTVDTDTSGRTNFFLHGGEKPGSAGCIDIGNSDRNLFPLLMKLRGPIYTKVK